MASWWTTWCKQQSCVRSACCPPQWRAMRAIDHHGLHAHTCLPQSITGVHVSVPSESVRHPCARVQVFRAVLRVRTAA